MPAARAGRLDERSGGASEAEGANRTSSRGAIRAFFIGGNGAMGRISIPPAGQRFKQRVEEWMQSLTDHDFDLLAARRDQLVGQLEALYRSVRMEMGVQT